MSAFLFSLFFSLMMMGKNNEKRKEEIKQTKNAWDRLEKETIYNKLLT
jgi:hypothetical protein